MKSQRQAVDLLEFNASLKLLLWFEGGVVKQSLQGILFAVQDYLELVNRARAISKIQVD